MIVVGLAWATCHEGVWTFGDQRGEASLQVEAGELRWTLGEEQRVFGYACEGVACTARPALWGEGEALPEGGFAWRFPTGEQALVGPAPCEGSGAVEVEITGDPDLVQLVGRSVWRGRNEPRGAPPAWHVDLQDLTFEARAGSGLVRTRGRVTVVASRVVGSQRLEVGRTRVEADDDGDMAYLLGYRTSRAERFVRRRLAEGAMAWLERLPGLVPPRVLTRAALVGGRLADGTGVRAGERFRVLHGEEVVGYARAYAPERVSWERVAAGGPAAGDTLAAEKRRYGYVYADAGAGSLEAPGLALGAGVGWQWTLGPGRAVTAGRVGLLPTDRPHLELGLEAGWVTSLGPVHLGPWLGAGLYGTDGGYSAVGVLLGAPLSRSLSLDLRLRACVDPAGATPVVTIGVSTL